jgi:hypothetical protein
MLGRVLGLGVVLAVALAAPSVATAAPGGSAAGWRTPASGTMDLWVQATPDPGTGAALRSASATLGGIPVATETFADGTCSRTCPAIVVLAVDTHEVPDGARLLVVTIEDVDGVEKEILSQMITVDNKPVVSTLSVTVRIGSGQISPPSSPPRGSVNPDDGPSCVAPRFSMRLAQKPLRYRRGVPVLARGRKYRYAGRLTCRINGRRSPAPRGTEVQVRNRVRGSTLTKPSFTLRKAGDVAVRLAYRSSRVVIFRIRAADGDYLRVRIPIRVVRVKKGRR